MKCEECRENQGIFLCHECDQLLCLSCDSLIHSGGKRKDHFRSPSCLECRSTSTLHCSECSKGLCENCRHLHSTHSITRLNPLSRVAVLWDVSRVTSKKDSVEKGLSELKSRLKDLTLVRLYSDCWEDEDLETHETRRGVKCVEGIFIDLCLLINSGISYVFIVSDDVIELKRKLGLIKGLTFKVVVSNTLFPPLSLFSEPAQGIEMMIKEEMENGKIIFNKIEILNKIEFCFKCSTEQADRKLRELVSKEIIIEKKFFIHQTEIFFYSLSMKKEQTEAVKYVIKSLKYEELSPTKKNIIIRLQKAFNINLTKQGIEKVINKLASHKRSASCLRDSGTYFRSGKKVFKFGEIYQPISHVKTTNSKSILALYDYFLSFCHSYFDVHYKKSIILGRFGLIILVKHSGPDLLKNLTTGKILCLITKAVSDGHIIYYKSSLIWAKHFSTLSFVSQSKLAEIKSSILALLSTMSSIKISKLGTYLKHYYNIKVNPLEFGYSNMRHLVSSMTELETTDTSISLKLSLEELTKALCLIISLNPGISQQELAVQLNSTARAKIEWKDYQVSDSLSFIQKYLPQTIEVQKDPLSFRCKNAQVIDRRILSPNLQSSEQLFDISSNTRILKVRSFSTLSFQEYN